MDSTRRIAANTGILYSKTLVTVAAGLWSTRLLLQALGDAGFGTYNLVAGVIAMLAFLNVSMTMATQRFMSYHQKLDKGADLPVIVACSRRIHLFVALAVVVLLECIAPWLFGGVLNIEPRYIDGARWIYQFMAVSTFATITAVPYDAMITAHENMWVFAALDVAESLLKLAIALMLLYVFRGDLLIWYGGLFAMVTVGSTIARRLFCMKRYNECKAGMKTRPDREIARQMAAFAGWSLYGTMCAVARNQGNAVILNIFFGTIVNAAYAVANQVNGQLAFLSSSLMKAFNPQLMSSEGNKERWRMLRMVMTSSRMSFTVLSLVFIPLSLNLDLLLGWWLDQVPEYTAGMCRLVLLITLVMQLSAGVMSGIQAINKVKVYNIVVGTVNLMAPAIGFVLYHIGNTDVYMLLVVTLAVEAVNCLVRIAFFVRYTELTFMLYARRVLIPCVLAFVVTYGVTDWLVNTSALAPLQRLVVSTLVSTALLAIFFWRGRPT